MSTAAVSMVVDETITEIAVAYSLLPFSTREAVKRKHLEEWLLYLEVTENLAVPTDNGIERLIDLHSALWIEVRYLEAAKSTGGILVSDEFKVYDPNTLLLLHV